jgi:hypothetical protein
MINRLFAIFLLMNLIILVACNSLITKTASNTNNEVYKDTSICFIKEVGVLDSSFYQSLDSIIVYTEKCISHEIESKFSYYILSIDSSDYINIRIFLYGTRSYIPLNTESYYGAFYYKDKLFSVICLQKTAYSFFYRKNNFIKIRNCSNGHLLSYSLGNIEFKQRTVNYQLNCKEIDYEKIR